MQNVVGNRLLHMAAYRMQVVKHRLHIAANPGGVVNAGGIQTGILCHVPDLGDAVDVVAHAHGVKGKLAQHREVSASDGLCIGAGAFPGEQTVAVGVAGAALGELTLQRHVNGGLPGIYEQAFHRVHHVGQTAAVNGGKSVRLAPYRRGVGLVQRTQDDGHKV